MSSAKDIVKEADLVCFCRSCRKIVSAEKKGKYYVCPDCKEENIVFGTEKSIKGHYNIK